MSNSQFANIVLLLNDPNIESVNQGLMLWETLLDLGEETEFYRSKLQELDFGELKGTFSYGFGGQRVPSWLRKSKYSLYVALWVLGYLAKHGDETALSIQKINLNDPEFTTFPETFIHLTGLTHFELQRSKWTELEDIWMHFPNLVEVDLFDNELTMLPDSLGSCQNLKKLNLSYNPLTKLPACVEALTSLQDLSIRSFKGTQLPDWFGELKELRSFNAESSELLRLPVELGKLKKLHTLKLRWSSLTELPESIGDCESLKSMDIASTNITSFPSTLPVLQAWETRINKAWQDLPKLSNLHTMEIWVEDLKRELDFAWFPSLKSLTINSGNCSLKNIGQCTQLEKLDVGRDQSSVPSEICTLSNLKELILSYSKVSALPNAIGTMSNLRKIGLSSLDLSEMELFKLKPLLSTSAGTQKIYSSSKREIKWHLEVDAYSGAEALTRFRRRLLMREFTHFPEMDEVEQLSGYVDADTPCANISTAKELQVFTLFSDCSVEPDWLKDLHPSPKLEKVDFKCSFTEFPEAVVRRLLGEPSLSEDGELRFPVEVKVATAYELNLWELKLEIAEDYGLLTNLRSFVNNTLMSIPSSLVKATSLETLSCPKVPCVDFPEPILHLPLLMNVEGDGDALPKAWPTRKVTFQTINDFLLELPSYTNLRTLTLKGAWLSEIPQAVLDCSTIRVLDLSWNRLSHLNYTASKWRELQRLILVGNKIESISSSILQLPNIKEVVLPRSCTDQLGKLQQHTSIAFTLFDS